MICTFLVVQRMFLFDNVPHVLAKVNGKEVILMVDSGAAGASLMFPSNVVQGFDDPEVDTPTVFRGRRMMVSQVISKLSLVIHLHSNLLTDSQRWINLCRSCPCEI
jgi:hypothetical protein